MDANLVEAAAKAGFLRHVLPTYKAKINRVISFIRDL